MKCQECGSNQVEVVDTTQVHGTWVTHFWCSNCNHTNITQERTVQSVKEYEDELREQAERDARMYAEGYGNPICRCGQIKENKHNLTCAQCFINLCAMWH